MTRFPMFAAVPAVLWLFHFALAAEPAQAAKSITNSIGMKLVLIKEGEFTMGSNDGADAEKPAHPVRISKPFAMGIYEVTQEQYVKVMGVNPSKVKGDNLPVEMVSWYDAAKFCEKLSALPEEKKAGRVYRLPTEAEWEYACRAGSKTKYNVGDSLTEKDANYYPLGSIQKKSTTVKVGSYKPNAWGLYDMHGNVREWCLDGQRAYADKAETDPKGILTGDERVIRGGGCSSEGPYCRSATRFAFFRALSESPDLGFRVVLIP